MADIKSLADKYEPYIIERRHYFHMHPELSEQEKQTQQVLIKEFTEIGADVKVCKDCYGLICEIQGNGKPGKTIAIRADIDALDIVEKTGAPYASTNQYMHACGHDGHIAMALGAAKILKEIHNEFPGKVRFIMQPDEEMGPGAKSMVKEGAMEGVDCVLGLHMKTSLDAPLLDVNPGVKTAASGRFTITVKGISAHASSPQKGVDAIVAAAAIINNLQSFTSREKDPCEPFVFTIGTINGGQTYNTIPNEVIMTGTIRTFSQEILEILPDVIKRICENTAAAFRATVEVDFRRTVKSVINNCGWLNELVRASMVKLYGEGSMGTAEPGMGGEDFYVFGEYAPAFYGLVGGRNNSKGLNAPQHSDHFDFDECVLKRGSALFAQTAFDYLNAPG